MLSHMIDIGDGKGPDSGWMGSIIENASLDEWPCMSMHPIEHIYLWIQATQQQCFRVLACMTRVGEGCSQLYFVLCIMPRDVAIVNAVRQYFPG